MPAGHCLPPPARFPGSGNGRLDRIEVVSIKVRPFWTEFIAPSSKIKVPGTPIKWPCWKAVSEMVIQKRPRGEPRATVFRIPTERQ